MPTETDPIPPPVDYGSRLSREEYQRRIVALAAHGPDMPSREAWRRQQRAEFDLRIDYRLGIAFPSERRDRLWAQHRRFDRRRLWCLLQGALMPGDEPSAALARGLLRAYASELDIDELRVYFELPEADIRRMLGR